MTNDPERLIKPVVARGAVIAVVTVTQPSQAVPLVRALCEGGVATVEVTLRTPAALEAIRLATIEVPEALVGAGTCLTTSDLEAARDVRAGFVVSPGTDSRLLDKATALGLPYLPGAATASDVMRAMRSGYRTLKFFPSEPAGGLAYLSALAGPFPQVRFCPTGGVTLDTVKLYLAASNVACVGGSWLAPIDTLQSGDWKRIEMLARQVRLALQ